MALTAGQWAGLILTVVLVSALVAMVRSETPETPETPDTAETPETQKIKTQEKTAGDSIAVASFIRAIDAGIHAAAVAGDVQSIGTAQAHNFDKLLEDLDNYVRDIGNSITENNNAYAKIQTLGAESYAIARAIESHINTESSDTEVDILHTSNNNYGLIIMWVALCDEFVDELISDKNTADGTVSKILDFIQRYEDGLETVLSAASKTAAATTRAENAFDRNDAAASAKHAAAASKHEEDTIAAGEKMSAEMAAAEDYYNDAVRTLNALETNVSERRTRRPLVDPLELAQIAEDRLVAFRTRLEDSGLSTWLTPKAV